MKKILNFLTVLLVALALSACGSGDKKANLEKDTYVAEVSGANLEATFTHDGDKLKKVEQTMEYPLSYFGLAEGEKLDDATKKEYEEKAKEQYKEYEDGKGTSLKATFTDEALKLEMSIDLDKVDADKVGALLGGTTNPKNVSYKDTVEQFEAQGFKKKDA
ncbi:DUF1307 domain-containing protein [Listeria goaensis]|uniref:DUF1307 domain-containing protein n=1 Tax=Listeria goaensis TaxID=1649188 RepID=UPI000B58EC61|nr:DUF1307 domain-containing protein [Listeria goaensis]